MAADGVTPPMGRLERYFRPDRHYDRISSVDLDALWAEGIHGFIMDLDNTLVAWRSTDIPPDVIAWATRAREKGFKLCIASNTRRYGRLSKVADALGASYVTGVAKPRRAGFRAAIWKMGLSQAEVAVIGDQLLTDILCARRLGVTSILVDRISAREFVVTLLNRRLEQVIRQSLERAGKMPPVEGCGDGGTGGRDGR